MCICTLTAEAFVKDCISISVSQIPYTSLLIAFFCVDHWLKKTAVRLIDERIKKIKAKEGNERTLKLKLLK